MPSHKHMTVFLYFLLELSMAMVLFAPVDPSGSFWTSAAVLLIMGGAHWTCFYLIYKKSGELVLAACLACSVLIGLITFLSGVAFMFAAILSGYLCWRVIRSFERYEQEDVWRLFINALTITFIYFVIAPLFPPIHVGWLTVVPVFLMLAIRLALNVVGGDIDWRGFYVVGGTAGLTIVTGLLIFLLMPVWKTVIGWVGSGIAGIVYLILSPIFKWLRSLVSYDHLNVDMGTLGKENEKQPNKMQEALAHTSPDTSWLLWIEFVVVALIVIVVFIVLWRKRFKMSWDETSVQVSSGEQGLSRTSGRNGRFTQRAKPPNDAVRKAMFQFQKKMKKAGFGRHVHETLSTWLERLPISTDEQTTLSHLYYQVRYGQYTPSDAEVRQFETLTNAVYDQVRRHSNDQF
ncbi:DUF4129 domain-containing protein [Tuberibacillus sp. Marseille-P3662]|uniref:DUF4129 domain-containing protein n=1 Tax=Tuberibacillus sp. Marseille-P3662 TaxID=1965358 RepID=UPI000A1C7CD9|nr:DUF4129 domain-containing protein [Tuberibacillus sp. Marseille-P3662]